MNKAKLKTYAPQARKDFIAAVTARAHQLGISETNDQLDIAPAEKTGDLVLIAGQAWPGKVYPQRERLIQRLQKDGFAHTLDAIAYTWFNRFAALRYMEIHDYLGHGHRVLSSREGGLPDILAHATELVGVLPGLKAQPVADMKLAGNQDGELYRLLLVAQCNALSAAMPFLFERIDDETELLLPDNLLRTDSVIAKLVAEIPEEDWAEVEIIGWLYQFYISEKKDQVIGKVVRAEDIPAATQLFTPNWIVQYLVQNSVGRLWLMANPASSLKSQWPYYIEPAEQTPEVNAQLDALIQTRMAEDGGSLNPESITVLDPACGSGHILVEAYALLKGIYLERGYRLRDIPRLILDKNLYGLDIDDRAAQLAGFALLMKARADDRRLFNDPPRLNVLSLQESKGLDLDELATHLAPFGVQRSTVKTLLDTFQHAKTFGSLIQIPDALNAQLPALAEALGKANETGDLYAQAAAQDLMALVEQARVLGRKFDAVVANPPYMGSKYLTPVLKSYLKAHYAGYEKDLFSAFMIRDLSLAKPTGQLGFMSPFVWMFISSYEELRSHFIDHATLATLVQLEYSGFDGATVPICTFTISKQHLAQFIGSYVRLSDFKGADQQGPKTLEAIQNKNCDWRYTAKPDDFKKIPGSPLAYWVSERVLHAFEVGRSLDSDCSTRKGMATGLNAEFVRAWHEVSVNHVGVGKTRIEAKNSGLKWFPYANGGAYRKWYGHYDDIVNWQLDGKRLQTEEHESGRIRAVNLNLEFIFKPGLSWTSITSGLFSIRHLPKGFLFSSASNALFCSDEHRVELYLALLNSKVHAALAKVLNPTLNANPGDIGRIPVAPSLGVASARQLIDISKWDWNAYERSWDFRTLPLLGAEGGLAQTLESSYTAWIAQNHATIAEMQRLEVENNRIFIDAYGLADELAPDVPIEQITLTVNPAYRYGGTLTEEEQWTRFRQDTVAELISYAIGCMMGRYSLDEPGLIYAHAGNEGFDATRYKTFPADADGIVPITDEFWFEDDAAHRVHEFLRAVWGADTLDENMAWLAESLGPKVSETPDETIRRYLADKFFKDHLQTYKKRPIYWLFSSGKQGAFQALVYLHRYHEGTLARLRAEYVVPLTGKLQARIDMLEKDAESASTATRNKINKQIEKLRKKHVELLAYDEKLRHHADLRIQLDLDDGVKVNYGKFGDLLAEVKAVTGGAGDE
ncbi:BREX-1 system adenine-specific DNA-methyltransferase PglX [Methyloparacoccus murrellii]